LPQRLYQPVRSASVTTAIIRSTRIVGRRVPRIEGREKVTGAAVYAGDVRLPGLLWGKVLRGPYPHARIRRIDTSRAAGLPGVRAVITAQDIPPTLVGRRLRDVPVLARDVVPFVGDRRLRDHGRAADG
jgi:CO/xanthine dehydrogenase Mo-binding subunit